MIDHTINVHDLRQLVRLFPDVSPRIIKAVLAGYAMQESAPGAAVRATHDRLMDALAA